MFYRPDTSDWLLEWPHKTTCQLIPKWPSQGRIGSAIQNLAFPVPRQSLPHVLEASHVQHQQLNFWCDEVSAVFKLEPGNILCLLHTQRGSRVGHSKDLSSLELSGMRRKFSNRGKCWGREVGELVCECQSLAGFVVPLGWLQLSGEEGPGALAVKAGFQEEDYNLPPN